MSELVSLVPENPAIVPLFPPLVLVIFIVSVAGAAALVNCALIAALIKRTRNGLFSVIIQLTIADFLLLSTSVGPELWTTNARTWYFGRSTCIAFRGISVFASTASAYLVATIALHTLATIKLEENLIAQRSKRNTIVDDEEMRSSRHSLVATSDTSTPPRTMNVDYRLADIKVPIAPPTIFVWFLSASLSIPEFALSTTIRLDRDVIVCTLLDSSHRFNIHTMLAVFNFFLPTLIMTTAAILVAFKLNSKKLLRITDLKESIPALKLSISLIIVYFLLCSPRSLLYVYGLSKSSNDSDKAQNLSEGQLIVVINLICSSLYLVSTLIRPLLCIGLLPRIRKKFSFGLGDADVDDV